MMMPQRRQRQLFALAIAILLSCAAESKANEQTTAGKRLLGDAGVSIDELRAFDRWAGGLTESQATITSKIIFRLEQLVLSGRQTELSAETALGDQKRGALVTVSGRLTDVARVALQEAAQIALDQREVFDCSIKLSDGTVAAAISRRVPASWLKRSPQLLDEPVSFQGVLVARQDGNERPLFITSRFQWRPQSNISAGVAWLVERGFDAALLDEIRHGRQFARPHESLEGLAFYRCMAIVSGSQPEELIQLARDALATQSIEAEANLANAVSRREALAKDLGGAEQSERTRLQDELKAAERRQAIAQSIVERAERGTTSVAPLFLEPEEHTGEPVLIEGTARRAIRIVVEKDAIAAPAVPRGDESISAESPPLSEYYELDVFTTDSQNLPIICCVARLPDGFPSGEAIREPVRVGGIFFKQWSYLRRADEAGVSSKNRPPQRLRPPLVLAAEPVWLRTAEPAAPSHRGLWAGLVFLAVFLAIVAAIVRVARRDRLAQAQRARYDAPLENIAEP